MRIGWRSLDKLGLTLVLLLVFLVGCGNLDETGTQELVMARVKDAINLDPSHATDGQSLNVSSEIMQGLVAFRPGTFEVTGQLARSWTVSRCVSA